MLLKRVPMHLEELKLFSCRISTSVLHDLLTMFRETKCQIKSLALVKTGFNKEAFFELMRYVSESEFLEQLDISWCEVTCNEFREFFNMLGQNRRLTHLNLSWNCILSNKVKELAGKDLELMAHLKDFIKYNTQLRHLNLSNTGLIDEAIKYIGAVLRRALSLRTIHLSGNPGVSTEMVEWIRARIHAKEPFFFNTIKYFTSDLQKIRKQMTVTDKF